MPTVEDQAAALLHVLGLVITGVLGAGLWNLASKTGAKPAQRRAVTVFVVAWVVLYTASVAFHLAPAGTMRQLLMAFDQGAIFILIAAGWAPLAPFRMPPGQGRMLLLILWSLAGPGIVLSLIAGFSEQHVLLHRLGFALYLAQATVPFVLYSRGLMRRLSYASMGFIGGSMVIYSAGLVFYGLTGMPWHHVAWHLAIVLGCVVNFAGMRRLLLEDSRQDGACCGRVLRRVPSMRGWCRAGGPK